MQPNRLAMKSSFALSRMRSRKALRQVHGSVLDVGCGRSGAMLELLPANCEYVGIDINKKATDQLRELHPERSFYCADVLGEIPGLETRQFDTVLLLAVIEHVQDPMKLLERCWRFLKPDGVLVISTPTPFGERLHKLLKSISLAHPGPDSSHLQVFSRAKLASLVEDSSFRVASHRLFELGSNQICVATPKAFIETFSH